MTKEEAKRILHPNTMISALETYNDHVKAWEEASRVACAAIDKLIEIEKWLEVQTNE